MTNPTRIALIDDHRMFLDGLSAVIKSLDPAYECIGYASPTKAIADIEDGATYDLVVSDLVMEEMNGVAVILALQARNCTAPILIISGIDTLPPIEKVLRLGAQGFVPKSASKEVLGEAIRAAIRREVFLPPDLWSIVEADSHSPHTQANDPQASTGHDIQLGTRQLEVLRLVAEGYANKRISEILGISENTVKTHIKQIFRQLNVTRRTACMSKAQSLGLLD